MNLDAINAISQIFSNTGLGLPERSAISSQQQSFEALLNAPGPDIGAESLLSAQGFFNELAVGVDMTAKVAGSITQSVNKLVNMS